MSHRTVSEHVMPTFVPPRTPWPRAAVFVGLRFLLGTVGRLSAGVRIGWRRGFDSGESLDHVYRNVAEGITPLGRLVDRIYLGSRGWRAIRQRKAHLQETLRSVVERVHAEGRPIHLVDIAAGPGRYVLEALQAMSHLEPSAVLRDQSPAALEAGRRLAATLGVGRVRYVQGDAFDRDTLARLTPTPTIAIASGLYELVPDNRRVLDSLCGLRDGLADDGYLIYTNQPWHPQLELIARVLTNREGRPWVMRCRPQAEIDGLVRLAGFGKVGMRTDEDGIFTVSVARGSGSRDGRRPRRIEGVSGPRQPG